MPTARVAWSATSQHPPDTRPLGFQLPRQAGGIPPRRNRHLGRHLLPDHCHLMRPQGIVLCGTLLRVKLLYDSSAAAVAAAGAQQGNGRVGR